MIEIEKYEPTLFNMFWRMYPYASIKYSWGCLYFKSSTQKTEGYVAMINAMIYSYRAKGNLCVIYICI